MNNYPILEIENLTYSLKNLVLLDNISFSLNKNETISVLGHNGSGKSLLIDCIMGNLKYEGSIKNRINNKSKLGILYDQFSTIPLLKTKEVLKMMEALYKTPEDNVLAKKFGINNLKNKYFKVLSKGERKKLGLYTSLFFKPEFLVLDEPTDGLDPEFRDLFWNTIKNNKQTLLITTHLWDEANSISDKIIFIEKGKILNTPMPFAKLIKKVNIKGKVIIEKPAEKNCNWFKKFKNLKIDGKLYLYYENDTKKNEIITYILSKNKGIENYSVLPVNIKDIYQVLKAQKA